MKILGGPYAKYCESIGNRGLTCCYYNRNIPYNFTLMG